MGTVFGTMTFVARGHDNDCIGFFQTFHHLLIVTGIRKACGGSTQRQVNRIAAQNNGIFNGGHIVRGISAAHQTEYLQHNDLCIRGITGYLNGFQRIYHLSVFFNVAVSGSNAGHMGAMVRCTIPIMGHIIIHAVYIVKGKGDLIAVVSILGCGGLVLLHNMELSHLFGQLILVQKIQRGYIFFVTLSCSSCILLQSIQEGFVGEGLVICVKAGINDGNPHTCAGVSRLPCSTGTRHTGGTGHQRVRLGTIHTFRHRILCLQHYFLNAIYLRNFLDLTILNVGRDHIGHQGQIPLNIQFLTKDLFDLFHNGILFRFEIIAVFHSLVIFRNTVCGIFIDCSDIFQEN